MTSQQTIDDLQYQKTQLVKQIHEAERQLTSLDTQIKTLEQVTKESPHIQAFVDQHFGLSYHNNRFSLPTQTLMPFFVSILLHLIRKF